MRPAAVPRPVTPVSILAAELSGLHADLSARPGRAADLLDRLARARDLAAGLDLYVAACTTPESAALAELDRRTRQQDWSGTGVEQEMLSGHVEGRFLAMLVHLSRARRVLEIGMFTGYSALAMAEALPDDGEVVACEIDPVVATLARELLGESPAGRRVRVEVGPARDTLRRLVEDGEVFDLVFLDADKAGYADYLDLVLGHGDGEHREDREDHEHSREGQMGGLLAPHGVVAVDNTLMQGEPWLGAGTANGRAITAFNAGLTSRPGVEQVLVPLRDGLTLLRRTAP